MNRKLLEKGKEREDKTCNRRSTFSLSDYAISSLGNYDYEGDDFEEDCLKETLKTVIIFTIRVLCQMTQLKFYKLYCYFVFVTILANLNNAK